MNQKFSHIVVILLIHVALAAHATGDSLMVKPITPFTSDTAFHLFSDSAGYSSIWVPPTHLDTLQNPVRHISDNAFSQTQQISVDMPKKHPAPRENWLFYVELFVVIVFVFITSFYRRFVEELWRAFKNLNMAQQLFRQSDMVGGVSGFLLSVNFFIVTGLYLFLLITYYKIPFHLSDVILLPACILLVCITYFFRVFIYFILTQLFPLKNEIRFISFNDALLSDMVGIFLLPFVITIAFCSPFLKDWLIVTSLLLLAGMLLYRFIRGWQVGKNYLFFHLFHFIAYICTVEIAPVMIIIRIILNRVND